jgi:DNA-binding NtrC family response regulator
VTENSVATSQIKVLIVEDEFFIADELRRNLSKAGLLVLGPTPSVDSALDLISEERPDVAVLDVYLGRERVTPVALELQALNVPFVLATASPAHELASEPVLAGALNLGKPTDSARLVETVRELAHGSGSKSAEAEGPPVGS